MDRTNTNLSQKIKIYRSTSTVGRYTGFSAIAGLFHFLQARSHGIPDPEMSKEVGETYRYSLPLPEGDPKDKKGKVNSRGSGNLQGSTNGYIIFYAFLS